VLQTKEGKMSDYKPREAVFDFDSIRARMSKDVEIFTPTRKDPVIKKVIDCDYCDDVGWEPSRTRANRYIICRFCNNPDDKPPP
jgi:formylmethanofuran dehydrogenase subunit E